MRGRGRLGVGLCVLWASAAAATVLVPMTDEDLVATSDLVVVGTVEGIESVRLTGPRIVTRVTLAVEQTIKGDPAAATVVVTEPGGVVGGLRAVTFGTPRWKRGERALAFLRERADGSFTSNALALGKYAVEQDLDGAVMARRRVPTLDARPLDGFVAHVKRLAAGRRGTRSDGRAGVGVETPELSVVTDAFELGVSATDSGLPVRWFEADCGLPVTYSVAGVDAAFAPAASATAVTEATAGWTGVATASIALAVGPTVALAPSGINGTLDGRNVVMFEDPFGEVPNLVNCSGVLALGGFASASGDAFPELTRTVSGRKFEKIFEGDVVMNEGMGACLSGPVGLAEVAAHEIGHTIGFAHSSEDPLESNPVLEDALMYFAAHDDGRGAAVREDDVAAATFVYPTDLQATTPVAQVACELGLGLLDVSCFGERLALAPFKRMRRAARAAGKAAASSVATKQQKLLKRAARLLGKTDQAIARSIGGACGTAMRQRVAQYRAHLDTVLATLL